MTIPPTPPQKSSLLCLVFWKTYKYLFTAFVHWMAVFIGSQSLFVSCVVRVNLESNYEMSSFNYSSPRFPCEMPWICQQTHFTAELFSVNYLCDEVRAHHEWTPPLFGVLWEHLSLDNCLTYSLCKHISAGRLRPSKWCVHWHFASLSIIYNMGSVVLVGNSPSLVSASGWAMKQIIAAFWMVKKKK